MAATVAVARLMAARREDIGEAKDDAWVMGRRTRRRQRWQVREAQQRGGGGKEEDAAAVDRTARHVLGIESWTTVAEFTPSADLTTTVEPAKGTRGW